MKLQKAILASILCVVMALTGCTAQWIQVALADLPILTQMALNIATLVTTLQGHPLSAQEAAAIQNISTEAGNDLNLLSTLYNQYKASADPATLAKIQNTIAVIDQNLPALLAAAHVRDPLINARVAAAVQLVLTTVQGFAALMPGAPKTAAKMAVPSPDALKNQWNEDVCAPTGDANLDSALAGVRIK